jgi:lipoate-protein ligase A
LITRWRLLLDPPNDGATNMARDEALARHAAAAPLPTLRLYAWRPACLSLGRFQRADDVRPDAATIGGVDVVRRPSGGRAILHAHELTYAVVAPDTLPLLAGGVRATYCAISRALLVGLRLLGVEAELAPAKRGALERVSVGACERWSAERSTTACSPLAAPRSPLPAHPASCFESASDYELVAGGRKLVGSAQVRGHGAILQHGSLPLADPTPQLRPLLAGAPANLGAHSVALDAAAGRAVSWDEAARALVAGFERAWGAELAPGSLTPDERATEAELLDKYAAQIGGVGEHGFPTSPKRIGEWV